MPGRAVGEQSPPVRHRAAAVLRARFGFALRVLPGCGHAAHLDAPARFAELLAAAAGLGWPAAPTAAG
ncbi:hypothetical protein CC117_18120 [Parafrankia colletiae]|uniref:Uncharacterized protein n=1 Tax=Parafrankia colletiae TaxID=573497 RepID=A0A1S1QRV6_9ACTN|nr:hypothetical protein [Parafrankia colletiae]MCK9901403.1 hypothetical protein [Frankia sp. Cpl3]OHV36306.1 hypothetical protein CC117_18120 [Parafrankia colletiae]